MGDCKNNLIDEVKEGDEVRGSFKDEATGKTYYTTGKIINNPKTKQSFVEDERGGITPIEDFFFLRNIKNENNYYPGISYQRLFNQINESGLNPTISQMTDIIHVVKEDFKEEKQTPYLGQFGTVGIVYNFNKPEIKKKINCELLAIYKDGRIVVQCYDIHGEKWESETFSRIEFFTPKN